MAPLTVFSSSLLRQLNDYFEMLNLRIDYETSYKAFSVVTPFTLRAHETRWGV